MPTLADRGRFCQNCGLQFCADCGGRWANRRCENACTGCVSLSSCQSAVCCYARRLQSCTLSLQGRFSMAHHSTHRAWEAPARCAVERSPEPATLHC